MSEETYQPIADYPLTEAVLAALLDDGISHDQFLATAKKLSPADLQVVYQHLEEKEKAYNDRLYDLDKDIRSVETRIGSHRFDYQRIRAALTMITEEVRDIFARVFENPAAALQKCREFEKTNGLDKTHDELQHHPATFGKLRGNGLSGFWGGSRWKALKALHGLDYRLMRLYYDRGTMVLMKLRQQLKG